MKVSDAFIKELSNKLGCEVKRTFKDLPNGGRREGITALMDVAVSPVMYVDTLSDDTTVDYVVGFFKQVQEDVARRADALSGMDKESVLSNLMPCLVKTEGNEDFLARLYHRQFDDMSIFYKYVLQVSDEGVETISVSPDLINTLGISEAEITEASLSYVGEHFKCSSLSDVIADFLGCDPSDLATEAEGVYMLSNEQNLWGSGCIVSNMLMDSISKTLFDGGQFVIIPSSVHEVLLIADDVGLESKMMAKMITDINRDHLKGEDVLSDHAYKWDGAKVVKM